jgi:hypothetical protein
VRTEFVLYFHIPKQEKISIIDMCPETFNLWVVAERVHLKQVLNIFFMRFNARLDTSHHGSPHLFKDSWAVADSLTGIHNAMVKWLFVVNRSCIHKGFWVSHR